MDIGHAETEQYDNNAKYYSDNAKTSAENAKTSETNAGESEVGAAGVLSDILAMLGTDIATLVGGKVPITQIPATAIHDVLVVTNESELVTLTAQKGDVAQLVETVNEVPTITKSWQLLADDATVASNWVVWGTSYVVQAGNATTATNAENANTINNHRIIAMTEAQYQAAISAGTIDETTIYLVGV